MSNKADCSIKADPMRAVDAILLDSITSDERSERPNHQPNDGIWAIAAVLSVLLALTCVVVANEVAAHASVDMAVALLIP